MRDWENLRYFLAVARNGTVSGAAKELQVSHSTVLRRVEQFEQALESKLFKKLQRGYELTYAGEQLYTEAQSVEAEIEHALARAEGHHDVTQGKLRISQPQWGIISIYPLYAEFQRMYPDITLEIRSTMEAHNIAQQEVDVVLRFSEDPPDLLVGRCLGTIKPKVYASKEYLKTLPKNHSERDYQWVIWQTNYDDDYRKWLAEAVGEPKIVMYSESMPDVINAISDGMGVGFLSSHEASKYDGLVELFNGESFREHKLWILTHRDLRNSERVKSFMRFIAERLTFD